MVNLKRQKRRKQILSENINIKITEVDAKVGILSVLAFIRQIRNFTGTQINIVNGDSGFLERSLVIVLSLQLPEINI